MSEATTKSGHKAGSQWLRQVDYLVGIPLLHFLAFFRRKRNCPKKIDRIAIIKADGMGDLVLLTAILLDLKKNYPDCVISLWCGGSVTALARELTTIDEVCKIDFLKPWQGWKALRLWKAEVIINAGQWSRSEALLTGMGGGDFLVGFETSGQNHHPLYDAVVPHRVDGHELDNFRALLQPLGISTGMPPQIDLRRETPCRLPLLQPYLTFHLWPSGVTHVALKQWPESSWAKLAEKGLESGFQIVLTGGPQDASENDRWIAAHSLTERVVNAAGIPMSETTSLVQNAAAVISVNTGVMHLAAALGVPTIGLHGPTNPIRWGPIGPKTAICQVPPPAGGYLNLGFEYPPDAWQRPGMSTITVDEVWEKLMKLIPSLVRP